MSDEAALKEVCPCSGVQSRTTLGTTLLNWIDLNLFFKTSEFFQQQSTSRACEGAADLRSELPFNALNVFFPRSFLKEKILNFSFQLTIVWSLHCCECWLCFYKMSGRKPFIFLLRWNCESVEFFIKRFGANERTWWLCEGAAQDGRSISGTTVRWPSRNYSSRPAGISQ